MVQNQEQVISITPSHKDYQKLLRSLQEAYLQLTNKQEFKNYVEASKEQQQKTILSHRA
jgi:hypothetical protein